MVKVAKQIIDSSQKLAERATASGMRIRDRAKDSRIALRTRLQTRQTRRDLRRSRRVLLSSAVPYLGLVRGPAKPYLAIPSGSELQMASYNVHRWSGLNGRRFDPCRAGAVISEIKADVIGLQEVLRPFEGTDPLAEMADALQMHVAFAVTRVHRHGELGNAIMSRWPAQSVECLNLSVNTIERRAALALHFEGEFGEMNVVATHLSLVDRTRYLQVRQLLSHPRLQSGPVVLLGDLNAWHPSRATRDLDRRLGFHHNREWPRTFPSTAPLLSLDRVYTRGVQLHELSAHDTPTARKASDHLPVLARLRLNPT